jgi:hypothetical protein
MLEFFTFIFTGLSIIACACFLNFQYIKYIENSNPHKLNSNEFDYTDPFDYTEIFEYLDEYDYDEYIAKIHTMN